MRYHYEKPEIYLSMYGKVYFCDHPVYHCCTLFQIGEKGLAVIQQRFDEKTKSTWWGEVDPWITDDLYLKRKSLNGSVMVYGLLGNFEIMYQNRFIQKLKLR